MSHSLALGAIHIPTGNYVYPKIASKKEQYKCPECHKQLILCQGNVKVHHFRHKIDKTNPCHYFNNPTETQIHKDAKTMLKCILEQPIPFTVIRSCCRCNKTEEFEVPLVTESSSICLEFRFQHNGVKIADVAYIDEGDIVCIFEICNTHKTNYMDRPEPWFEFNAQTMIQTVNENNSASLRIPCIRRETCESCVVNDKDITRIILNDIDLDEFVYLKVDFSKKDLIKKLGGKWNNKHKVWYITKNKYKRHKRYINQCIGDEIIWIGLDKQHIQKIDWEYLSSNPNAISVLEKHLHKIEWDELFENPNAINIIEQNIYKLSSFSNGWYYLSNNPNAIHLIEQHLDKVDWERLSSNPNAIHLLEQHLDEVDWGRLSSNPNAIHLLEQHLDEVNWYELSSNPNAIHLLEQHLDKVNWNGLSRNSNAIPLLERNVDKIDWFWLSRNPNAIRLLERNMDKVSWYMLSSNPNAIHLLEQHLDKVNWGELSSNPNAIHLLEQHLDKVSWYSLHKNPNAVHLLDINKVNWGILSHNPSAIPLIEQHLVRVNNRWIQLKQRVPSFVYG